MFFAKNRRFGDMYGRINLHSRVFPLVGFSIPFLVHVHKPTWRLPKSHKCVLHPSFVLCATKYLDTCELNLVSRECNVM